MSRGFVKEDDQEEPPMIPPRAPLPNGVINYVTQQGLDALKQEHAALEEEISNMGETDERERRKALAVLNGKLNLLVERIQSARLIDKIDDRNVVRFGAYVTYKIATSPKPVTIQLVGVDEADVKKQKISFISPIASALTGKKVGESVGLKLGNETRAIEIVEIEYNQ